jgi:3',5'-cyclic AMP phosphodiesterase CpdA
MKRLLVGILAGCLVVVAVAFSGGKPPAGGPADDLQVVGGERNPWNHLRLNNGPGEFQFAIVSDRTGGHRPRVFSQAVARLNLLQPEFVMSVGDLIEGYTENPERLAGEWREFQGFVGQLEMPFFYVPGNHDISNPAMDKLWKEKFGRRYYYFVYKGVLFVVLNSEDPPGVGGGNISEEQRAWLQRTLAENRDVRWTLVFLHKPLWTAANLERNGWLDVEKALAGRPYTVFCGHVHRYQKFVRNGQSYYQLATTGGGSKLRGTSYGEFDHIVWVTMKQDGPVLANIMLDGVLGENLQPPASDEPGVAVTNRRPCHPVRGQVFFDGCPPPGAYIVFTAVDPKDKRITRADALVEPDGSFTLSTYTANDGAPAGEYVVTVVWRKPFLSADGKPGPNLLPERYSRAESSGLKATVKAGTNTFTFDLTK